MGNNPIPGFMDSNIICLHEQMIYNIKPLISGHVTLGKYLQSTTR